MSSFFWKALEEFIDGLDEVLCLTFEDVDDESATMPPEPKAPPVAGHVLPDGELPIDGVNLRDCRSAAGFVDGNKREVATMMASNPHLLNFIGEREAQDFAAGWQKLAGELDVSIEPAVKAGAGLQQEGALPDSRGAAEQHHRAVDEAAAEHPVELGHRGGAARMGVGDLLGVRGSDDPGLARPGPEHHTAGGRGCVGVLLNGAPGAAGAASTGSCCTWDSEMRPDVLATSVDTVPAVAADDCGDAEWQLAVGQPQSDMACRTSWKNTLGVRARECQTDQNLEVIHIFQKIQM